MNRTNKDNFIENCNIIHNNKYNYSLAVYTKTANKIQIICPIHGIFEQKLNNHLQGKGCRKCSTHKNSSKQNKGTINFIKEATEKYGDLYDYSKVDYKNTHEKVCIICNKHNQEFFQIPKSHLKLGTGCKICKSEKMREIRVDNHTGWTYNNWIESALISKYFDSFKVYIIKCWNENEEFYKIGRTYKKVNKRFYKTKLLYNFEIIAEFIGNPKEIWEKEIFLKNKNKKHKYIPKLKFNGMYECFSEINIENEGNI